MNEEPPKDPNVISALALLLVGSAVVANFLSALGWFVDKGDVPLTNLNNFAGIATAYYLVSRPKDRDKQ